jgi:hypothetical protein
MKLKFAGGTVLELPEIYDRAIALGEMKDVYLAVEKFDAEVCKREESP